MGKENENETYDPEDLPLRTHGQFKNQISRLSQTNSEKERKNLEAKFGIIKYLLFLINFVMVIAIIFC
jgi:hypothetical protein